MVPGSTICTADFTLTPELGLYHGSISILNNR